MRAVVRRTARPQKADASSSPSRLAARKPKATSMADWMEIKPFSFGRSMCGDNDYTTRNPRTWIQPLWLAGGWREWWAPILGALRPAVTPALRTGGGPASPGQNGFQVGLGVYFR